LQAELALQKESARAWRSAFHSLRASLEGRLDRLGDLIEELEFEDELPTAPGGGDRP
jgi:hypothetical protein